MHHETVTYQADGCAMRGELFVGGDDGRSPGVLVFPEAFGLGAHALGRAERLAAQGYAVLACDLHGDRRILTDMGEVMALLGAFKAAPARSMERASAALDVLAARADVDPGRIAAIGHCFGGTMAFDLARAGAPIVAAAGFHAGLAPTGSAARAPMAARILACVGADDPSVDQAQRAAFEDEMRQAGADWQLHVYGGVVHSFTNPEADARGAPHFARYDAAADARSWTAMTGLLDQAFSRPAAG